MPVRHDPAQRLVQLKLNVATCKLMRWQFGNNKAVALTCTKLIEVDQLGTPHASFRARTVPCGLVTVRSTG